MATVKNIETGVDKLITLIHEKKNVDAEEAAHELGVSVSVVREWAEFLEEENLIGIEYGLSKVTLTERKITKKEAETKLKDYHSKKDAFVRKVETTLKSLERETDEFQMIKEEFKELKKHVGTEMEDVKNELDELKHYEDLKQNIDNDINRQKKEYLDLINDARREIDFEEKRYTVLTESITKERSSLEIDKKEILQLEDKEDHLKKRLEAIYGIVKSIEGQLGQKESRIEDAEKHITKLQDMAASIEKNVIHKKTKVLEPLLIKSKEQTDKIALVQDAILDKITKKETKLEVYAEKTQKISDRFRRFFDKKIKIERLLTKIDGDKHILDHDLNTLIKKIQAFDVLTNKTNASTFVKELTATYKQIDNRKSLLRRNIEQLSKMIRS
ncbi:MAG: hypothetical protein ABIB43_03635 [archaeon]